MVTDVPDGQQIPSENSIIPRNPYRIPIPDGILPSGGVMKASVIIHSQVLGDQDVPLLVTYREVRPVNDPIT